MAKSLAEFKRDANEKKIEMKILPVGIWENGVPARLEGWRKAIRANSVAVYLLNNEGKESYMGIPCASLAEYTGDRFTLYNAGLRDLTEEEKKILDGWKKKSSTEEFKERAYNDAMTDGSGTYWDEVLYFEKFNAKYLMGLDWERGKKYDFQTGKVFDQKVKGAIALQYEVRKAQN